jgi:hypothetical protein
MSSCHVMGYNCNGNRRPHGHDVKMRNESTVNICAFVMSVFPREPTK